MNARKPFWQKSNLIHQRPHASKKPYECEEYKNVFYSESSLTLQQRTHTREKPYQCRECWKAFYSKSKLLQHQQHIQVRILNYVNNTEKVLYRSCFSLEIRFHSKGKTQECEWHREHCHLSQSAWHLTEPRKWALGTQMNEAFLLYLQPLSMTNSREILGNAWTLAIECQSSLDIRESMLMRPMNANNVWKCSSTSQVSSQL